jgi:hypothetical protein
MIDAGLAVGGVEEYVPKRLLGQAAVAERRDLDIELLTDARDLGLGDPGAAPRALTRSSTLRVDVPCR